MAYPHDKLKRNMGEIRRFLTFAIVGVIGFVVDASVLYLGIFLGLGLRWGRVFSYLAAVRNDHVGAQSDIHVQHAVASWTVVGVGALFSLSTGGSGRESGGLLRAHPHQRVGGDPSGPRGRRGLAIGLDHKLRGCPSVCVRPRNSIQT